MSTSINRDHSSSAAQIVESVELHMHISTPSSGSIQDQRQTSVQTDASWRLGRRYLGMQDWHRKKPANLFHGRGSDALILVGKYMERRSVEEIVEALTSATTTGDQKCSLFSGSDTDWPTWSFVV